MALQHGGLMVVDCGMAPQRRERARGSNGNWQQCRQGLSTGGCNCQNCQIGEAVTATILEKGGTDYIVNVMSSGG